MRNGIGIRGYFYNLFRRLSNRLLAGAIDKKLIAKHKENIDKRADAYFAEIGIDPNAAHEDNSPAIQFSKPQEVSQDSVTVHACIISIRAYLFYSWCEVFIPALNQYFVGHSGGVGIGTTTASGAIYYVNQEVLFDTTTFGVFFINDGVGAVQVTWGSHGNATAGGLGSSLGAFGGTGKWTNYDPYIVP